MKGLIRIYLLGMAAFLALHLIWLLMSPDLWEVGENFVRGALGISVFMGAVMIIGRLLAWLLRRMK